MPSLAIETDNVIHLAIIYYKKNVLVVWWYYERFMFF